MSESAVPSMTIAWKMPLANNAGHVTVDIDVPDIRAISPADREFLKAITETLAHFSASIGAPRLQPSRSMHLSPLAAFLRSDQ
jgi:hypothetical protein